MSQSSALAGTVKNGDVFIAAHSSADPALFATADMTTINAVINWNGDDAIVLRKGTTVIDLDWPGWLRPRDRVGYRSDEHSRQHPAP